MVVDISECLKDTINNLCKTLLVSQYLKTKQKFNADEIEEI